MGSILFGNLRDRQVRALTSTAQCSVLLWQVATFTRMLLMILGQVHQNPTLLTDYL